MSDETLSRTLTHCRDRAAALEAEVTWLREERRVLYEMILSMLLGQGVCCTPCPITQGETYLHPELVRKYSGSPVCQARQGDYPTRGQPCGHEWADCSARADKGAAPCDE